MFRHFRKGRKWRCRRTQSSAGNLARGWTHNILVRATALTFACLWMLILAVIALARLRPLEPIGLPSQLQPGSPLPQTAHCLLSLGVSDDCRVALNGQVFDVTYNSKSRVIYRTLVSGKPYVLGDLLLAWGTPSGFTRLGFGCGIVVMWHTRAAHLIACGLQFSSHIDFLEYALNLRPGSTWRGLT